jgi:hypothetical protein
MRFGFGRCLRIARKTPTTLRKTSGCPIPAPVQCQEAGAEHHRKEAAKCHELAKYARPAYLGDFYRRVAMCYLSMAQDILRQARERGDIVPERADRRYELILDVGPVGYRRKKRGSDLRTNTCPPNSMATVVDRDSGEMQDPVGKAERYRREANKCAELAKSASPAFLGKSIKRSLCGTCSLRKNC